MRPMSVIVAAAALCALTAVPAQAAANPPAREVEADIQASVQVGETEVSGAQPVFSPDGKLLYTAERDTAAPTRSNIRVIDTSTNKTRSVLRVGIEYQTVVRLTISPDGRRLYALQSGGQGVSGQVNVIDTAALQQVATITPPVTYGNSSFGWMGAQTISPDGRYLYFTRNGAVIVPGSPEQGTVYVVDTASNSVVGSQKVGGWVPDDLVISPNGRDLYISAQSSQGTFPSTVRHFDASTVPPRLLGEVQTSIGPSEEIGSLALSPDGKRLYAMGVYPGALHVVDTASDKQVAAVEVPNSGYWRPIALSHDGRRLYVADTGPDKWGAAAVTVINTGTATVDSTLVGFDTEHQYSLVLGADDKRLYVVGKAFEDAGQGKGLVQVVRL